MTSDTSPEGADGASPTPRGWQFRPGLVPTLAALAVLPILLMLGFWQLERSDFKRDLIATMDARATQPAVAYVSQGAREPLGERAFTRVIAPGRYLPGSQVLLDNRTRGGVAGYEVFTPLRLADGAVILVRRGWVPLGARREVLPDVAVGDELREVRGTLITPPTPGLKLGEGGYATVAAAAPAGTARALPTPRVLQWLDMQALRGLLKLPRLEPGVIALERGAADGYARDAVARTFPVPPERHHGYAVQWFALAATVIALWVGLNLRRRRPPTPQEPT